MSDKLLAELIAAMNNLNKTIIQQQKSKSVDDSDNQTGARRKDSQQITVKLDDNKTFKELKGLIATWTANSRQNSSSPTAGMEANRRLTGSVKNLNKNVDDLDKSIQQLDKSTNDLSKTFSTLNRHVSENIRQNDKTISGNIQFRQELGKLLAASKNYRNMMNTPGGSGGSGGGSGNNNNNQNNTPSAPDRETNGILSNLADAMGQLGFKIGSFMSGVTGYVSDFTLSMKTGSQFNAIGTPIQAASMGLSAQEYIQLGATYRNQAMRLADGTNEWMSTIKSSQRDLLAYTGGDMLKAAEISSQMNSRLMNMGFGIEEATKMIGSGENGYIGALKRLTFATGKTVEELDSFVGNILTSDNVRSGLFKLDREQRTKFLTSQTDTFQKMFNITGSLDRAKQIMDQMNNRQGMTGVDRIRDAVRGSVAARAMGLSSSQADELMRLRMVRPEQLNDKQNARLAELNNLMSRGAEGLIGSGNLGAEIFAQTAMGKLQQDLKQLQTYNTTLDQPINQRTLETQMSTSITKAFDNPQMQEMLAVLEIIKKSLGSNLAAIVVGGFASVIGVMLGKGIMNKGGFGRFFGGSGSSGTGAGGVGSRTGGTSSGWKPGNLARGVGLGAIGAGGLYALDKMWSPTSAGDINTKEQIMDYGSNMMTGAAIGTMIAPGIGTAIGGLVGGIYTYTVRSLDQKNESTTAAEERNYQALTEIQKNYLRRKHVQELESIELFKRTMTNDEKIQFDKHVQSIESQHGVRIKSVNDLAKFENDELKNFINRRTEMLKETHKTEMDYINKKQEMMKAQFESSKKLDATIRSAKDVTTRAGEIYSTAGTRIEGSKVMSVLRGADAGANPSDVLTNAYLKLDSKFKADNGITDQNLFELIQKVESGTGFQRYSTEGKLAEKLVAEIAKTTQENAKQAQESKDAIARSSLTTGLQDISFEERSKIVKNLYGDTLTDITTKLKSQGDIAYDVNDLLNDIAVTGKTAFPQINDMLNSSIMNKSTRLDTAFGSGIRGIPTQNIPSDISTVNGAGVVASRTDTSIKVDSENRKNEESRSESVPVMLMDPRLIQELQKQTEKMTEFVEVGKATNDKIPTFVARPGKFANRRT